MASIYEVEIRIGLVNQASAPLQAVSGQLRGLNQGMQEATRQASNMGRAFTQIFLGRELMKFGEIGERSISKVIKSAANLETAMLAVQSATGMSGREMAQMGSFVQRLAASHTMSVAEAGRMTAIIGQSTFKDPSQIRQLLGGTGGGAGIADFADIMRASGRITDAEQSTRLGLQFASLTGAGSDPKKVGPALDAFSRALRTSTGSPEEIFNIFKQIAGTGQTLAQDPTQMLQLASLVQQKGLGTRTTTSLANQLVAIESGRIGALQRTRGGQERADAMRHLGVFQGDQNVFAQLDKMRSFESKHGRQEMEKELFTAFDRRGAKAFMDLLSPDTANITKQLREEWTKIPPIQQEHAMLMDSVNAKLSVFSTNLETAATNLGKSIEPFTKMGLDKLIKWSDSLGQIIAAHPNISAGVLGTLGAGATAATVAGGILTFKGLLSLFRNGGLPVFVVNQPGGPSGPGGASKALSLIGRIGTALATPEAAALGLAGIAGAEGLYALSQSPKSMEAARKATEDQLNQLPPQMFASMTRHTAEALASQGKIKPGEIDAWVRARVDAEDVKRKEREFKAAIEAHEALKDTTVHLHEATKQLHHAVRSIGGHVTTKLQQAANLSVGAKAPAFSSGNPSAGVGSAGLN